MALLPPPASWSLVLPPRLKLKIAEAVTVYSNIVSCIIETRWLVELKLGGIAKEDEFKRKMEIAREYAHKQNKAIQEIVKTIPGAETDAIWPAMKEFAADRDLIAHGVWMVDNEHRPIVVWHSKMLESTENIVGEYFDYERFDHMLLKANHLLKTFAEFKTLLTKTIEETAAPSPWNPRRAHETRRDKGLAFQKKSGAPGRI